MWKTRLPANTQRVIAATTETNVTALTEIADQIHENRLEHRRIAAITRDSEIHEERKELKRFQISAIANNRQRSISSSQERRQSHSRSVTPQRSRVEDIEICWYHRRFKNKNKRKKRCKRQSADHRLVGTREMSKAVCESGTQERFQFSPHFCNR